MFGLLNLNKPAGWTSRDVVNRVARLVRPFKAGHAGTLDPLATGVLVVGLGSATRLMEYVQRYPKTYRGVFLLGRTSDTEDTAGAVQVIADAAAFQAELERALPSFLGTIMQRPPAYSALKVAGARAYDLARRGVSVELAPRPIEVHSLTVTRYEYPTLELEIVCGSGTYVRSLGRDLAEALGTGAIMSSLIRTAIGPFEIAAAIDAESVTADAVRARIEPAIRAVDDLPRLALTSDEVRRLHWGQRIADRFGLSDSEAAAVNDAGDLVAIVERDEKGWKTKLGFPNADAR